ncbi:MAG: class I SAM-dependent methyltransferase [Pseudomonadales bacterium]|nr:class I SAM-dependent methyltransferase [Pseudomonadales bacterium]
MKLKQASFLKHYSNGKKLVTDKYYVNGKEKSKLETLKETSRTEIINHLLSKATKETTYLEIGVRDPSDNFDHIIADKKFSVDPGVEFLENPVDFKMTSDEFFDLLADGKILSPSIKFDVIFIDGLHLAEQVDKDIENAMRYIKDDGFIVLHDCNPPTEWHARENYRFQQSPAGGYWNGTTWKAFLKWRYNSSIQSCCIDSDWGVGILSKTHLIGQSTNRTNHFFEFDDFNANRDEYLNLISFSELKNLLI